MVNWSLKCVATLAVSALLPLGVDSADAQTIDTTGAWDGVEVIQHFGQPNTATYGQTITPTAGQTTLQSFTFYLAGNSGNYGSAQMQAFVYEWDPVGNRITGSPMFASSVFTGPTSADFVPVTISTGGTALAPGSQYVLFFTASTAGVQPDYSYRWASVDDDTYLDGRFVFMDSGTDFSMLLTDPWAFYWPADISFIAVFGPLDPDLPTPPIVVITGSQIAAELKLQAARQGLMLSDAQSRSILNQMRLRMARGSTLDPTATASLTSAFVEDDAIASSSFGYANATGGVFSNGGWTAWADTSADGFKGSWSPDVRGYQARQQFGMDYRFANGWIGGVSIGGGIFDNDFDNGGSLSGTAFWVQPYAAAAFGGWLVSLQAAYTYTDYNAFDTGLGLTGDTHGNRISGSVTVSRQFDLAGGFYVTPEAALTAGKERISNLSILPATEIEDPAFFNARIGGEVGYHLPGGGRVYGIAFAEYTDTNGDGSASYLSTGYQADSWSATLGGGFDAEIGESVRLGFEGRVRGIGSDTLIYGASARLSVDF